MAGLASLTALKAHQILLASALLVFFVIVLGIAVWYYRRRWLGENAPRSTEAAWTFEDLRKLRDQSNLTEEEYQAMRSVLIGMYQRDQADARPSATSPGSKTSGEMNADFDLKKSPPG